ncbi:GNAT family N-acetyltransferase [Bradyrhizobium sp. IC3123]|uniref:GNAT family N-acetyltransferase n=1 Tax=Bradyrhizobium sp. IC3123 TaxID=2793803 RepID=UPI001CD4AB9D|nr:GNAT family N-acetyltransferase [Bradyrhizobium sp. IC3123]MCA1393317.1 GNAT family N-acetyltransferase [Bradyrhizobium sp. IC3123]
MTEESDIRSANANIRASTVWTIVLGFAADPLMRWSWPDPGQYLRSMPQFIDACGGRAFAHGTAYVAGEIRGAALWLPPNVQQDEEALDAIMALSLRPEITEDMAHLRRRMAEHRPHEPHWYLPLIAVDPNWVGKGLGTLLMNYALQRCDEDGIVAYLESSNPENIPFYQRHGFKVVGEIQHGSSPPLTPMLRTASFPPSKAAPPDRLSTQTQA